MRKDEDNEAAGSRCFDALLARNAARLAIFVFAAGWAAAWAEEPQTTLRTAPPPFDEGLPPVGKGQLLSEEQVAYCLAQSIRLDAVRPLVDRYRKAEVEYFNALARDFTSRCGSYLYEGNARDVAKGLVEANRARVESDARAAYAERFPDEEKQAVESKPPSAAEPAPPREVAQQSAPASAAAAAKPASSAQPAEGKPAPASQPPMTQRSEAQPAESKPPPPQAAQKPEVPPAAQKPEKPAVQKPEAPAAAQKSETPSVAKKPEAPPAVQKSEAPPAAQKAEAPPAAQKSPTAAQKPETPTVAQKVEAPSSAVAPSSPSQSKPSPAPPPSVAAVESQPSKRQQTLESKPLPPVKPKQEADADAILERYTKEIRKLGSRVLDQRDYVDASSSKRDVATEIEVRYAAGGYIRSIDLGESSGFDVLDQRALAICRSMRFPRVPEELHSRDFKVRFPIVFRAPKPG